MRNRFSVAVAIVGASALVGTVLTNALASQPPPFQPMARAHKNFGVSGNLTVTGVLKVNKNNSVYGKLYAHGGAQVWKGLKVTNGTLSAPALTVTGPAQLQAATVSGNFQAGAVTAASLSTTNAATIGGKLTANGVDAGAGGLTTSGSITTTGDISGHNLTLSGALSPQALNVAGAITAGSISTTGPLAGGSLTVGNLTATGTVDLSKATVSGLGNLSNVTVNGLKATGTVDLSGATLIGAPGFGANPTSLSVGAASSSTNPLTLTSNNRSASLGVDSTGALTIACTQATSACLTAVGGTGIVANGLSAPTTTNGTTTALTALSLSGSTISLAGNTSLTGGSDFGLSSTSSGGSNTMSHILANNDTDAAGQVGVNVATGSYNGTSGEATATVQFTKNYTTKPIIDLTAAQDPIPLGNFANTVSTPGGYRVWVTYNTSTVNNATVYTGFVVHYFPPVNVSQAYTVYYNYHVIGS